MLVCNFLICDSGVLLLQGDTGVWGESRLFKQNLLLFVGLFAFTNFLHKLSSAIAFGVTDSQEGNLGKAQLHVH